jgi:hypothetical protein
VPIIPITGSIAEFTKCHRGVEVKIQQDVAAAVKLNFKLYMVYVKIEFQKKK